MSDEAKAAAEFHRFFAWVAELDRRLLEREAEHARKQIAAFDARVAELAKRRERHARVLSAVEARLAELAEGA